MSGNRPNCADPDRCAARRAGHCKRCGRQLGGCRAMAKLLADPGFRERVVERARGLAAALSRNPDVVARRSRAIRATMARRAAERFNIPIDLVDEYRWLRAKVRTRPYAIGVLRRSYPALFGDLAEADSGSPSPEMCP